jgi:DNA uptake protein ComE-like DNA-binding protein
MWKDYLSFFRQEQKGFVFLITLIIILFLFRLGLPFLSASDAILVTKDDSFFEDVFPSHPEPEINIPVKSIPDFDPNNISKSFLVEIGIHEWVAQNWVNYLSKGGVFNDASDVGKVYGIDSAILAKLQPYMFISKNEQKISKYNQSSDKNSEYNQFIDLNKTSKGDLLSLGWSNSMIDTLFFWLKNYWVPQRYNASHLKLWSADSLHRLQQNLLARKQELKSEKMFVLDMNKADTSEWDLLKGVGPVISKRIVAYRKKLGGFYSSDQLLEVYGISPILVNDILTYLTVDSLAIKRLDINKASLRQLRDHPYLDFYKAQALVEERKKRGRFASTQELLELKVFNDAKWEKAQRYLVVN